MDIRKAKQQDSVQLDALVNALLQEEAQYDIGMNPEFQVKDFFLPLLEQENYHILVAEEETELLGYVLGYELPTGGLYLEKVAYVDNMLVRADRRNQGIGTALMNAFKEWCKVRGITEIGLRTCVSNEVAVQFLRKNGFGDFKMEMKAHLGKNEN